MSEKRIATFFDLARFYKEMCDYDMFNYNKCSKCPLSFTNNGTDLSCKNFIISYPHKTNTLILKWLEEHPIKTMQS